MFLIVCILFIYTLPTYHFITVIICSHNTDNVLYELYVSTLNQVCSFSRVLSVAPWWWFPCKPKHVEAASLVLTLKCFKNSMFFNVVFISWTIKCWTAYLICRKSKAPTWKKKSSATSSTINPTQTGLTLYGLRFNNLLDCCRIFKDAVIFYSFEL